MSDSENPRSRNRTLLFFKGVAMGAADVVPGVSGGTIAFISGIYQELLFSIRSFDVDAIRMILGGRFSAFWHKVNGTFLAVLFCGILCSYALLAHAVEYLMNNHGVLLWSFFFGLILASIVYIFRQLDRVGIRNGFFLLLGTAIALFINLLPPLVINDGYLALFASAALAICAMILPGISGSFILLLLGMYPVVIEAVTSFDVRALSVFLLGCVCGLLSFSRLLSWLLARFFNATIALLTGFLVGSLVIVWPWKDAIEVMVDRNGREVVLSSRLLSPWQYADYTGMDSRLIPAIGLMIFGLILVLGLEYLGAQRLSSDTHSETSKTDKPAGK